MQVISIKEPNEAINLDANLLEELMERLDSDDGENQLFDAIESIAQAIGMTECAFYEANFTDIEIHLGRIRALSNKFGFTQLAIVSAHAQNALMGSDIVALAATIQRVVRVGEQSLMAIWDFRTYS